MSYFHLPPQSGASGIILTIEGTDSLGKRTQEPLEDLWTRNHQSEGTSHLQGGETIFLQLKKTRFHPCPATINSSRIGHIKQMRKDTDCRQSCYSVIYRTERTSPTQIQYFPSSSYWYDLQRRTFPNVAGQSQCLSSIERPNKLS